MRAPTHSDFVVRSQAWDLPIVRNPRAPRRVVSRFELTGVVDYIYDKPATPFYEPVVATTEEQELAHPRSLPAEHPRHIAWKAKVSTSKKGIAPSRTRKAKPGTFQPRPCRCCPDSFTPVCAVQLDCATCIARIPKLLRTKPRQTRNLANARGHAKRLLRCASS